MLRPSSRVAILPSGYLTLATITFSADCFEIIAATSRGVVWKLTPSFVLPSGKLILMAYLGKAAYLAF